MLYLATPPDPQHLQPPQHPPEIPRALHDPASKKLTAGTQGLQDSICAHWSVPALLIV